MYDAGKVIAGVVVFLVLVTSPLWINAIGRQSSAAPALAAPPNGTTACVESTEFMRARHMDLLNDWREAVVREGRRLYVSSATGASWDMSLSRTCMNCHSNKAEFCDRCHTYMAVSPYCWSCHVEPKEAR